MSESSLVLGANTSAFTIGARAPKSSVLLAASASRSAPRPRGTGSSTRIRRTTSRPMPPPRSRPLHFPATTHVVPPRAAWSSGQRNRTEPPHVPGSTSASAIPPRAGAGSASRTITARVRPSPALPPAAHRPVHVASRSRTAAVPQSIPATAMIPTAAPSGARRCSSVAATSSGATTYHAPRPVNGARPPHRPAPKAIVRKRIGGRICWPPNGSHQLYRPRPTARREPHLAEPFEQRHVQLGLLLIAVQSQLHQHFALGRGHVVRREAIEREHEDISAARLAAAEPGQLGTQLRIFPLHDLERHIRHPTTASSSPLPLPLPCTRPSGTAVKVEPVVPVK